MSFLKLTVNSQRVALPDDFVIRMVYKMPYPFLENIPGAITYWFNLPSNDINDIIFKHANFIYVVDELKVFTCLLEIGSIQLTGELYMKNASNQEYKLFIAFRETLENFGKKKLSQVVQGTSNLGASTAAIIDNAETMQEQNYPNVDYGFPAIINTEFFDDNPEFKGIMNNWDYNYGGYWPNYYDSAKDKTINRNVLVPQPYLLSVLDKAFENIGFDVCGYLHNSGKFNKMVLYSNYALEKYSSIDYFLGGENSCQYNANGTQYYIDIDAVVKDEDNTFNLSTNTYSSSKSTLFWVKFRCEARYFGTNPTGATFSLYLVDGSSIIGQVGTDVVTNTISYYEFETSVNRSSPSLKVFLSSNSALSDSYVRCTSIELEIYPGIDINVDKFSGNIDLKNHVPDLSVSDFLNGIVKKFCQASFFDFHNKSLELVSWNDIIDSSEYIDLTSYVIKDSEKLNFDFKKFSLLTSWNDDSLTSGNFIFENNQNMTIVNEFLSTFPTPTLDGQLLFVSPLNLVLIAEFNVKGKLQWNYKSDYFQDVVNNTLEEEELIGMFTSSSSRVLLTTS